MVVLADRSGLALDRLYCCCLPFTGYSVPGFQYRGTLRCLYQRPQATIPSQCGCYLEVIILSLIQASHYTRYLELLYPKKYNRSPRKYIQSSLLTKKPLTHFKCSTRTDGG